MTDPFTYTLHRFLRRQERQALSAFREGRGLPDFRADAEAMAEALQPIVVPYFLRGGRRAAREIGRKVKVSVRERLGRTKAIYGTPLSRLAHRPNGFSQSSSAVLVHKKAPSFASWLFRVFFPKVGEAVRRLTLEFCEETNRTTRYALQQARSMLRAELLQGLEEGEALGKLTQRVRKIFATERAYTIARTEGNRAVSAGGLLAAKESGVVEGKTWLSGPESCDFCRKTLNGKTVGLDEPFAVLPGGGLYSIIMHPPAHPHCVCDEIFELYERYAA